MKQTSDLTRRLTLAQEQHLARTQEEPHAIHHTHGVVYRLYTEDCDARYPLSTARLVTRYFSAATIFTAVGIWGGQQERSHVVEIVGTVYDLQRVFDLAGDIRVNHEQPAVLIVWTDRQGVHQFTVTAATVNEGAV